MAGLTERHAQGQARGLHLSYTKKEVLWRQRHALDAPRARGGSSETHHGHGDHEALAGDELRGRRPTANTNPEPHASTSKGENLSSPCGSLNVSQPCRRGRS